MFGIVHKLGAFDMALLEGAQVARIEDQRIGRFNQLVGKIDIDRVRMPDLVLFVLLMAAPPVSLPARSPPHWMRLA